MLFAVGHTWETRHELAREAERFAAALLYRELDDAPVYIALASELPHGLPAMPHCLGFASKHLDMCLRESLGDLRC